MYDLLSLFLQKLIFKKTLLQFLSGLLLTYSINAQALAQGGSSQLRSQNPIGLNSQASANTVPSHPTALNVLLLGETLELPIPTSGMSSIYIHKRIVKAQAKGKTLHITAQEHGHTYIKMGDMTYHILILSDEEKDSAQNLNQLFAHHPTLKVSFSNQSLELSGELLSSSDLQTILNWLELSSITTPVKLKLQFVNFIKGDLESVFSKKLQQAVKLEGTSIEPLLFSSAPSKKALDFLKKLNLKYSHDEISEQPIGRLKIYFAEVKKNKLEQISPLLVNSHPLKPLGLDQLLTPEFQHTDENLFSSIGSQVEVLLFDQQPAHIHSGGEFPILNQSFHRSDVSWKQFGLFLDVQGKDLHTTDTVLDLSFKLSMLVSSNNDSGVPSLTSDSWKQKIRVKKNQTYILKSGFTKHHLQGQQGSSIFKHIPIFKFLFQGRSKNTGDTDLVLVLSLSEFQE